MHYNVEYKNSKKIDMKKYNGFDLITAVFTGYVLGAITFYCFYTLL